MISDPPAVEQGSETAFIRARAFAVHVLTASGAACALLALIAAVEHRWSLMFAWLGIALVIDGIDGTIARRVRVAAVLPRWSGEILDFVVDFAAYVFVPAYAIAASGLLPPAAAVPAGVAVAMSGALYFADRRMKTDDNYFRGFPAVWNVVAFYLFILKPEPWLGLAAIAVLAVLTFVPVPFVHPLRVERLRPLNIALVALWNVLCIVAIARDLDAGPWINAGLAGIALYFLAAGVLRRAREA